MQIKLTEDFIEKLENLQNFQSIYAAMWIINSIEPIKRHWNGSAIRGLAKFNDEYVYDCIDSYGLYRLGYIQAMIDLEQPLIYNKELSVTQEFLGRAFDALGIEVFNEGGAAV